MYMKSSTAIALRVSKLLVKTGMTRYKLCRKIAITETTLKHILDEEYKSVNFDTLVLLADGFDMTVQEFLDDELFARENLDV
ncbi:MAG: helix-turn-helix transcriptional regulator [Clostridiales bacterium]|nr:helix-turn-helix transcriptional regulator [Clostridiales bacterium]